MAQKPGGMSLPKSMAPKKGKKRTSESDDHSKPAARRKECPDCGSPNVLYEATTEQLICHDCGLIFEELVPEVEEEYERVHDK